MIVNIALLFALLISSNLIGSFNRKNDGAGFVAAFVVTAVLIGVILTRMVA
jgi:hypothetical protein